MLDLIVDVGEHSQKSTGLTARLALVAFSLVAGLSYRVVVGALTASIVQFIVLAGLALVLPPGIEYLLAYCGAAKLGAITAGVNNRLSERERAA